MMAKFKVGQKVWILNNNELGGFDDNELGEIVCVHLNSFGFEYYDVSVGRDTNGRYQEDELADYSESPNPSPKDGLTYLPHMRQALQLEREMTPMGLVGVTIIATPQQPLQQQIDLAIEAMKMVVPEGTNLLSSVSISYIGVDKERLMMLADAWKIPEASYNEMRKNAGYQD